MPDKKKKSATDNKASRLGSLPDESYNMPMTAGTTAHIHTASVQRVSHFARRCHNSDKSACRAYEWNRANASDKPLRLHGLSSTNPAIQPAAIGTSLKSPRCRQQVCGPSQLF
mmetsp:Transcript_147759/g.411486  ORF Transcript_147759/g.411486 Transcript_147759/m.411486 type:complete len:113 (+) Transcript_147759:83-421(+)